MPLHPHARQGGIPADALSIIYRPDCMAFSVCAVIGESEASA